MALTNPSFEPPREDSDCEVWLLRAPAHLDVSSVLDGVTLDVDHQSLAGPSTSSSAAANSILSRFKSAADGSEYALTLGDASESDSLRLLVPDGGDALVPHRPFERVVHLTASCHSSGAAAGGGGGGDVQADLALAPSRDAAPEPAFDETGNGSVEKMRLAYVPVPQRQGLKRRWAMPGSRVGGEAAASSALRPVVDAESSTPKKKKQKKTAGDVGEGAKDDEEAKKKTPKSSSKKEKKEKKKKEKKSKKSPKQ